MLRDFCGVNWLFCALCIISPVIYVSLSCLPRAYHVPMNMWFLLTCIQASTRILSTIKFEVAAGPQRQEFVAVCAISRFLPFTATNRDFSRFPRLTAIFSNSRKNPRLLNTSLDKPRYFKLHNSLFYIEFNSCGSKQF